MAARMNMMKMGSALMILIQVVRKGVQGINASSKLAIELGSGVDFVNVETLDEVVQRGQLHRFRYHQPRNWQCNQEEDEAALKFERKRPETIGFYYFAVEAQAQRELRRSVQCSRLAFNETKIQVFVGTRKEMPCPVWKQHDLNHPEYQRCWDELMRLKLAVARSFPFDIVLMLDTDVRPNPHHVHIHTFLDTILYWFQSTPDADFLFGPGPSNRFDEDIHIPFGHVNGGFLAFRSSLAVDRFFHCTLTAIQRAFPRYITEQQAYNALLFGHPQIPMRSIQATLFPANWVCKAGSSLQNKNNEPCLFTHSHLLRQFACGKHYANGR